MRIKVLQKAKRDLLAAREFVKVYAVLDNRRNPATIADRLA